MWKALWTSIQALVIAALFSATPMLASAADFYEGKTLRLVPYVTPGSAQDILARLAAPYLKKYIAGHPNVIVHVRDSSSTRFPGPKPRPWRWKS